MTLRFANRNPAMPIGGAAGKQWTEFASIPNGNEVVIRGRTPNAAPPNASWATLAPTAWSATLAYPTIGSLVLNGGQLFSSLAAIALGTPVDWRATATATPGTARYNHTGRHLAVSTSPNSGAFPTNLTGTWRLRQVGEVVGNAPPPNASYTTLTPTAHSPSVVYPVGALVTSDNKLWRANTTVDLLPNITARNTSGDISLPGSGLQGGDFQGGFATATRLYFVSNQSDRVVIFDHSGNRQGTEEFALVSGNINWRGGCATSTRFYIVDDTNNIVRAYDHSGNRQATDDISLGTGDWSGAGATATRLYFLDNTANYARAYDHSGNRQATDDINLGAGNYHGIISTAARLYFVDNATFPRLRAYDHSGNRQMANDISLGSNTSGWSGGFATATRIYVINGSVSNAIAYDLVNPAPENDPTRWTEVTTTAWSEIAAYSQNTIVTHNNGYFQANTNIAAPTTPREVDGALTIVNPASGGVQDIRVGSAADMQNAFGNVAITSGGNFELRKLSNAAPADDTANWSQVVVSPWDARKPYLANAIVSNGDPIGYFRANANIAVGNTGNAEIKLKSALITEDEMMSWDLHNATPGGWRRQNATPTPATTYTAIANWQATHSNTLQGADYYNHTATGSGNFDGALFANYDAFATSLTNPPNGTLSASDVTALTQGNPTYRLRLVNSNGLPAGATGSVVGQITILSNPFVGRFSFRVGTAAQMRTAFGGGAAFGIANVTGEWVLDRQN